MTSIFKTVESSKISISELMLPSHANFSGKIHGGYVLSLLDQIAFACASKFSGNYCVTASVDTVNFLTPIEVGELVTMKASINYIGKSSMVVGIRVEAENIRTGKVKHCNSSYFTMVAMNDEGNPIQVPGLEISTLEEVRRFHDSLARMQDRKEREQNGAVMDYTSEEVYSEIKKYNVRLNIE